MPMSRTTVRLRAALAVLAAASVTALVIASPAFAEGFAQGKGSKAAANWKVEARNASGRALNATVATSYPDGGIGFEMPTLENPEEPQGSATFLATDHPGPLLGDLTGKTITATVEIEGEDPVFTYDSFGYSCSRPASVRFIVEGNTQGPFNPADYWWSNPVGATLESLVGKSATLSVPLEGSQWSNYYGHFGTGEEAEAFAASVADVTDIGLSFGGGCFFSNGAGLASGSATFHLLSFSVH